MEAIIITIYFQSGKFVTKKEISPGEELPKDLLWIDLIEPTQAEEVFIEKKLQIEAPNREEQDKIEVISPYYKEGDSYFMTITALFKVDADYPESSPVSFILTPNCLVTVRHAKPRFFTNFAARILRQKEDYSTPGMILEGLVETLVNRIGDVLEKTGNELDNLLLAVFDRNAQTLRHKTKTNSSGYYDGIIKKIGRYGNFISKNRESLVSVSRLLIFFNQIEKGKLLAHREQKAKYLNISREVGSLTEYANFLSQRINFLLDATLGMLNVEQNMIIKVFTVAAAVFMPPTLIASIYGMNFKNMPEISWIFGYPMALVMIVVSALIPYYYFKRKGWL